MNEIINDDPRSGSKWPARLAELRLYAASAVAVFAFMGTRALFGSENRWAEAVREMLLSGDIFHPCLNNVVYFDKPILSYWLIYGCARIFGGLNEWVLRLPSAVFAILGVWATVRVFSRLFSHRAGVLAGWMLLSCWGFLWWARSAEADIENMAMIILAFARFIRCRDRAGFLQYLVFYLIIFVGALFKGLPAVIVPLAAAGIFAAVNGQICRHLKISNFLALVIGICAFFAVPYLSGVTPPAEGCSYPLEMSALELAWRENIVRAFNAFDHKGAWYTYFYELPRVLVPWSPFFVLAVGWGAWNWKKLDKDARALLIAVAVIFLLFSLSQSRRWYYILPIAPFAMGLTSLCLLNWGVSQRWLLAVFNVVRYVAIVAASLAILLPLGWPLASRLCNVEIPVMFAIVIPVIGLLIMSVLIMDERNRARLARRYDLPETLCAPVLSLAFAFIGVFAGIIPAADAFRTTRPFLLEQRSLLEKIPPERVLLYSHEPDCDLLFYWDFPEKMNVIEQEGTPQKQEQMRLEPNKAKREQMRKAEIAGSHAELRRRLRELSESGGEIILVSFERNMLRLTECGVPETPEFSRFEPDFREPAAGFSRGTKDKFWIWKLDPEKLRSIYESESSESGEYTDNEQN